MTLTRASALSWAALACVLLLAGCAAKRPVLYPNDHYKYVGPAAAEADVDACISLAEAHNAKSDQSGEVASDTAIGAGVGAITGLAVGAVLGSAGRGAAAGGAGGAVSGLVRGLSKSNEPAPIFKGFVEQCLSERGYRTIGWE